jgi:Domain of unknown function (DUF4407)
MGARLRRFLVWLSGADPELLRWVPEESGAFQGLAWAIIMTSAITSLGIFFGLCLIGAALWLAIPLSAIWFLLFLNLDRSFVVSLQRPRRHAAILLVGPQIVLAIMFASIVSTTTVLHLFRPEISVELTRQGIGAHPGLLDQLTAFNKASAHDGWLTMTQWALFLLFALTEMLPVMLHLLRLYAPAGAHEGLDEQQRVDEEALMEIIQARRKMAGSGQEYAQGLVNLLNNLGLPPDDNENAGRSATTAEDSDRS